MPDIKLVMDNRTSLDLLFVYNGVKYNVPAKRSERTTVEAGHKVSVHDPNHTKVTRDKREVEYDYYIYDLIEDTVIVCELTGWQLKLRLGRDVV
jgi:hypothetical protein